MKRLTLNALKPPRTGALMRACRVRPARQLGALLVVLALLAPMHSQASERFVRLLSAELLLAQGQEQPAMDLYQQEALQSRDPDVIERALSIANNAHDTVLAQRIAQHWTQLNPNHIPAQFYLAHLALVNHEYPLAADTLDQILRFDPNAALDRILAGIYPENPEYRRQLLQALSRLETRDHPALLVLTAGLLAQDGQTEAALSRVDRALQRRPDVTALITLKASILQQQGRLAEVAQWLEVQTRRLPDNKSLQLYRVRFLIKAGQPAQALEQLARMSRHWPRDGEISLLAGLICIDLKKPLEAERYLLQLLPLDEYVDQAYYYLGINAERQGHTDTALIYLLKVESPDLYRKAQQKIVSLRLSQNRLDDALNGLTQQRVDHPDQSDFLYLLQAHLLRDHGRNEQARKLIDEALSSQPDQAELLYMRVLLLHPDESAQKMADLHQLLNLQPNNPIYINAYAYALAEQNVRLDEARQLAEQANQLDPDHPAILDTLGYIALRQNRLDAARDYLEQAFAQEQGLNTGLRLLQVLALQGQTPRHREVVQQLQQLYPQDERVQALQVDLPRPAAPGTPVPPLRTPATVLAPVPGHP